MNASSLLPKSSPSAPAPAAKPVLTSEQLDARKAAACAVARLSLLREIAALKAQFEAGVAKIQAVLDKHPLATRTEILGGLTSEQREAFGQVAQWAATGLAAFSPPAESPPASPVSESEI